MAGLNFDANQVAPTTDFEPIPAGKYLAVITGSEIKPTKSGNGSFLELTYQVLDGQYKGRLLWARLNLDNPNRQAVEISRGQLSTICRSVGVMKPNDSVELHGIPLMITVRCKRRDDGEVFNEIKGFSKKDAATGQPQQETSNTPPWARK